MKIKILSPLAAVLVLFTFNVHTAFGTEPGSSTELTFEQQEITDEQLRKFASAVFSLRQIDENARTEMGELIRKQGMELERFNEIYKAKQNPAAELDLSEQVEQQYENIINELEVLQQDYLEKKQTAITEAGIDTQTFQIIANRVQTDPDFRERVAVIIESIDLE